MGTSISSKGPSGKNPLIPPWAEESDTTIVIHDAEIPGNDLVISNSEIQKDIPKTLIPEPTSNRFQAARRAFGDYAKSGDRSDLRRSLGHYARNSTGKGAGAARRLASGITAGSGLFGLLNGNSVGTDDGFLNLADLSGLTTDQAIDRIVSHLTPNSPDSDLVRTAMNFALSEALQESESIDDTEISPDLVGEVIMLYLTDLIFQQVLLDMGESWFHAETALMQINMENELRELVKVIVDSQLDKMAGGNISSITNGKIAQLQASVIRETITEWEQY